MMDHDGVRWMRRRAILAAALSSPAIVGRARAADRTIRIGLVTPATGPLAAFAEADGFILDQARRAAAKGIVVAGQSYPVQIIVKDSQSSVSRASDVAADLILGDKVDMLLASGTPDTVNPVADQAELNEVPCITTDCPWQAYFFGRKGDPKTGFDWTYHFFWGLEDIAAAFIALGTRWRPIGSSGACFPTTPTATRSPIPSSAFPARCRRPATASSMADASNPDRRTSPRRSPPSSRRASRS